VNAPYRAPQFTLGLPASWEARLRETLDPGERILWAGAPGVAALKAEVLLRAVVHVLGVIAGTVVFASLARDFWPMMFPVWCTSASLVLAVVAAAFGDWRRASTTFYAATEYRTLLFEGDDIRVMSVPMLAPVSQRTPFKATSVPRAR
jgi:hypothetical protein